MQQILKANELPPGARMMGRQGRALTGMELADGLSKMVAREVDALAGQSCQGQAANQWWHGIHLTFPHAKVEWATCSGGIWLRLLLASNKDWEFRWCDKDADVRNLRQMGPFVSPDDFREALGLARIAQFKLPGGDVVTAELPESALRPKEIGSGFPRLGEVQGVVEEVDRQMEKMAERVEKEIMKYDAELLKDIDPSLLGTPREENPNILVDLPQEELLAEPPTIEPVEPVVVKAKPVGAALKGKGGKRK